MEKMICTVTDVKMKKKKALLVKSGTNNGELTFQI